MRIILFFFIFCYVEGAEQIQKSNLHFLEMPQSIIRINIISLLDLSSINWLSQASSQCNEYASIQSLCYSRFNRNYFNAVPCDYIECTRFLAYISMLLEKRLTFSKTITRKIQHFVHDKINKKKAQEIKEDSNNKITYLDDLFEFLWGYDQNIRNTDIIITSLGESLSCNSKIQLYSASYKPKCFNRTMSKEIQNALKNEYNEKLYCLLASKNINFFTSLLDRSVNLYFFKPKKPIEYNVLCLFVSKFINHNKYKQFLLIKLFQQSKDSILCQLLQSQVINADFTDEKDCNLLHYSAFYGFPNVIKMLVDSEKINIYSGNYWKKLPLDYAVNSKKRFFIAEDEYRWFWDGAEMYKIFNEPISIKYQVGGIR